MSDFLSFRRLFLLILLLLPLPAILAGQSFRAFVKAGDRSLAETDFYAAMVHYAAALERREEPAVHYKYAEVARQLFALDAAAEHYEKALNGAPQEFSLALFQLGKVRQRQGRYREAIDYFEKYLQSRFRNKEYAARAREEIESCRWARTQQPDSLVKVKQLGRRINSPYSEFGPYVQGDTLYYSSLRYDFETDDHQPPRKISRVLYATGSNGRGRPLRRSFNAADQLTAHVALSTDRRRLYFTRCEYVSVTGIRCGIWYRDQDGRGRWESKATRLPEAINLPGFTATQPAIGLAGGGSTEVLFFASDRPGGQGGLDIWMSAIAADGKSFGEPEPLLAANTAGDDLTPFFHQPTRTLYFSSDGHPGLGSYDILSLPQTAGGWGSVQNLGPPINTSYNDVYFFLVPDGREGYLSSNRPGSFYLDEGSKACCNDLYRVTFLPPATPSDTVPDPGVPTLTVVPDPPAAEAPPETLEDFLPLALYFDNDEPDRRTRRTVTRKTYGETFLSYYQRKEEYLERFAAPLPEERQEDAAVLVDAFFEEEVRKGHEYLRLFSEILLQRLEAGEQVEVFIRGYTSPRARSDYNLALGKRRISSLRNHFDSYREGAFRPYLRDERLVITERSFGEALASKDVSDDLTDERNSIYSPAAARERRVEIEEVERN